MTLLQDGLIAFLSAVGLTALVWLVAGAVLHTGRPIVPGLLLVLPLRGEALAMEADILLMDEPFGALDAQTRTQLQQELLNTWEKEQKTCFFITHDVEEMIEITDTITVLRDGAVAGNVVSAETTPDEIKRMMVGRRMDGAFYRTDQQADYDEWAEEDEEQY